MQVHPLKCTPILLQELLAASPPPPRFCKLSAVAGLHPAFIVPRHVGNKGRHDLFVAAEVTGKSNHLPQPSMAHATRRRDTYVMKSYQHEDGQGHGYGGGCRLLEGSHFVAFRRRTDQLHLMRARQNGRLCVCRGRKVDGNLVFGKKGRDERAAAHVCLQGCCITSSSVSRLLCLPAFVSPTYKSIPTAVYQYEENFYTLPHAPMHLQLALWAADTIHDAWYCEKYGDGTGFERFEIGDSASEEDCGRET